MYIHIYYGKKKRKNSAETSVTPRQHREMMASAAQVETLVVLLTQSTLSRPWCAGEIVTAAQKKIHQIAVQHEELVSLTDVRAQFKLYWTVTHSVATSAGTTSGHMTLRMLTWS